MSDYLIELVEMIESEFPTMSWDELTEKVMDLLEKKKDLLKFKKLNKEDKFDYLVDGIITLKNI